MTDAKIITDQALVDEMQCCIWRDEARRVGFSEPEVEQLTFLLWRLRIRPRRGNDGLRRKHRAGAPNRPVEL